MKLLLPIALVAILGFSAPKNTTSVDVIKKMYNRYNGKWHKTLTFTQTTGRYRNDSLIKSDTWFERIAYPDRLRIDIGGENSGNSMMYKGDSLYIFRSNKLVRTVKDENELIFFLGGMHFKPYEQVVSHFADLHIDLAKGFETTWHGKPVYVLGANGEDEKVNQLWVDKEKLVPVRYFKFEPTGKVEMTFEDHIKLNNAWSETNCKFFVNGKLIQTESYKDVKADLPIGDSVFDPKMIGK